jgi:NAD(P)-dependent dehydrogenase (short-subunit alcohol dehydrogenase family)
MLLEDRTAIVYGGGGAIGAAVAGGFAREGARVYLAGRNIAALDATARNIRAAGGIAEPAHVAWAALAGLCRQLAAELGPRGIRVAWLLSPGSPDVSSTYGNASTEARAPDVRPHDPFASATLLKRRPTYDDVANVAVFLASGWAATMTATEVNITGGAVVD